MGTSIGALETGANWWHGVVGYSVYIRSFGDSNGDGIGDIGGIIAHLDHLEELGVNLLWVTPFYPSPMADFGYDVTDYCAIDSVFGDFDDFDRLVADAHSRDIRVILDLVPNHTSIEHAWFTQARNDPAGEYGDYYIWADPAPDGGAPNNWVSYFGGPAWTLDEISGRYYLHLFLPDQPDLNWRNERVRDEFDRVLRFWLDRGIDGFRVDVAQGLVKDAELRCNPRLEPWDANAPRREQWEAFDHLHDVMQPESLTIFERWAAICSEYDAFLIGETSVRRADALAALLPGHGLHAGFWFQPMNIDWDAQQLLHAVRDPLEAVADPRCIGWMASSLDEDRGATRFGANDVGRQRALALSTVLFCLPGVPFIYQGEELGLVNGVVPAERRADPVGSDATQSRDGCRTPMPWTPGPTLGFSAAPVTWLPTDGRTDSETVAIQREQTGSWFERFRALVSLRRTNPELQSAPCEWVDVGENDVVAFRRGRLFVAVNVGDTALAIDLAATVLFDTHNTVDSPTSGFVLHPAQAVVLRT